MEFLSWGWVGFGFGEVIDRCGFNEKTCFFKGGFLGSCFCGHLIEDSMIIRLVAKFLLAWPSRVHWWTTPQI